MLSDLPDDVVYNIFAFLNINELLPLRTVSQRIKQCVDFALSLRKKEVVFSEKDHYLKRLNFLSSLYNKSTKLCLDKILVPAELMFHVFVGKFPKLECIEVIGTRLGVEDDDKLWPSNFHLIGQCFPFIKEIILKSMRVDDNSLCQLFSLCQQLETIELSFCLGIGRKFLKHFANSVKHLSWKGQILWSDFPPYMRDSDITGFGRNFESLTYDCFGEEDGKISSLIANEMKNLKYLYLSIRDLYSFSNFSLPHLVTLNLSIRSFIGTTKLQQPCMLAKTVDVEFKSCGETDLADFISNFPNVENLRIILLSGNQIVFDAKLMKQICSLRSLRFFEFRDDKIGTNKYLTLDGGVKNAFVETIRSLHWVEKIKLRVSLSTFLMNELRQIAEQRPNQFTSEINIGSYDLNDEDFDDDDTVSEFSD